MDETMDCPECEGKGWYWVITGCSYSGAVYEEQEQCDRCNGSGYVEVEPEECEEE